VLGDGEHHQIMVGMTPPSLHLAPPTQKQADAIRFLSVDAIVRAAEGHQGVPLGMADIATALYTQHLKFVASEPQWWDRDRVVLSNGHGSMLLYSLLYLSGYQRITLDQIKSFREFGSHCAGHPEFDPASGIEVTTGPLGQGIANAFGMAVAETFLNARFGSDLVDHYTYAFVGDGCLQEGVGQEMISLAGHLQLGKLVLLWDDNQITDDGGTALSISEDVAARFRVAGWHVLELDGHDLCALDAALTQAKADPRPSLLACRTIIAKGIARLQGQRGGHSARLFPEDAVAMRNQLDWPHPPFEIPQEVLGEWRRAGTRHDTNLQAWTTRLQKLPAEQRQEFERVMRGELPKGWQDTLLAIKREAIAQPKSNGGINLSATITDALTDVLPERMVACADLEAPTGHKQRLAAFTATHRAGAYVHCGVREHVMGAMANGMAAHGGVIALSVTYLAFVDYQRPALRMAALMGLPVKYVFSHDSIGIGRNGPTHQPVEILASLRSMPNMLVMRPADAVEVAECWQAALQHRSGPVCMVFSRQALHPVRCEGAVKQDDDRVNLSQRGAYVLAIAHAKEGEGLRHPLLAQANPRQVTLLATGSEVSLAMRAREQLQQQGVACAVVSMPCWELFEQQDLTYRRAVLGTHGVRIGIEAAMRFGWDRYLREGDGFVGMSSFGASGPADALYQHFGITINAIVNQALERLHQLGDAPLAVTHTV
jgi:transketolase